MKRPTPNSNPIGDGLNAALAAAWYGDWSGLILRLRSDAPLETIERQVLANALERLVSEKHLRPKRGAKEQARRYEIAKYVADLVAKGVGKTEAVRQAEDEFNVENPTVWKAIRELKEFYEHVWEPPQLATLD